MPRGFFCDNGTAKLLPELNANKKSVTGCPISCAGCTLSRGCRPLPPSSTLSHLNTTPTPLTIPLLPSSRTQSLLRSVTLAASVRGAARVPALSLLALGRAPSVCWPMQEPRGRLDRLSTAAAQLVDRARSVATKSHGGQAVHQFAGAASPLVVLSRYFVRSPCRSF